MITVPVTPLAQSGRAHPQASHCNHDHGMGVRSCPGVGVDVGLGRGEGGRGSSNLSQLFGNHDDAGRCQGQWQSSKWVLQICQIQVHWHWLGLPTRSTQPTWNLNARGHCHGCRLSSSAHMNFSLTRRKLGSGSHWRAGSSSLHNIWGGTMLQPGSDFEMCNLARARWHSPRLSSQQASFVTTSVVTFRDTSSFNFS